MSYIESLFCAVKLFFNYYRQYGADIKVIRIFNTYGPRMSFDKIESKYFHANLKCKVKKQIG